MSSLDNHFFSYFWLKEERMEGKRVNPHVGIIVTSYPDHTLLADIGFALFIK